MNKKDKKDMNSSIPKLYINQTLLFKKKSKRTVGSHKRREQNNLEPVAK